MNLRWLLAVIVVVCASVPSVRAEDDSPPVNPEIPRDLHGLWWEPGDAGWAVAMFDHTSSMSSAILTYDRDGVSTWLSTPNLECYREAPPGVFDRCRGPLYRNTGTWFGEPAFRSADVVTKQVGDWSGIFLWALYAGVGPNEERALYPSYTVDDVSFLGSGQRPMFIQVIDPEGRFNWRDGSISGSWGKSDERGWSVGVWVQNKSLFATLLVHGPDKQPRWYVVIAKSSPYDDRLDPIFEGEVYETRGFPWGLGRYGSSSVRQVGSARLHFGAEKGDPASLDYSIDGIEVSKTISRMDPTASQ